MSAGGPNEIETSRLRLRAWREGDWGGLHRAFSDPQVTRWLGAGPATSVEETAYRVGRMSMHWDAYGYGMWAAEEKDSGQLIGRIGLMRHNDWPVEPHKIEIGWTLARSAWGRGYATEGARAGVDWAFETLGLERLISITTPDNVASWRVMQKCGFSKRGRAHWHEHDVDWWALDRSAWERRRELSSA